MRRESLALGLAATLAIGQDAPPPKAPVDLGVLDSIVLPTCMDPELSHFQAGRIFARDRFLLRDDGLYTFHAMENGTKEEVGRVSLPPLDGNPGHFLKFRDDAFWYCNASGVLGRWDVTAKRWIPYARLDCGFQDFDVLMDGRILLVLPSDGPGKPQRNVAELYDPREKTFSVLLPFPDGRSRDANSGVQAIYWSRYRSFALDEYLFIYGGLSGRLYCYDCLKGSLREVGLPWKAFEIADMKRLFDDQDPRVTQVSTTLGDGTKRSFHRLLPPVPVCVEFIPTLEGRLLMVYETMEPGSTVRKSGLLEIDPRTGEAVSRSAPASLKLPLWSDPQGRLIPLQDALNAKTAPR